MDAILLDHPVWSTTFPHRVTPLYDEWLASLLLRCDEVNHWASGETLRFLIRSTGHPGFGPKSSLIIAPQSILDRFAQYLMSSSARLLATTYATELAHLYPPVWYFPEKEPYPGLLLGRHYRRENWSRRHGPGPKEVATERRLHLCPACIAQTRSMRRTVTLPHLHYCPIHQVALQERCPCGRPLSFFSQGKPPFACDVCGLDWAQWPQTALPLDRVALERDLLALYELFLLKGTPELRASALRLARHRLKENESLQLKVSGKTLKSATIRRSKQFSLAYLVDILVSIDISPNDITGNALSLSRAELGLP